MVKILSNKLSVVEAINSSKKKGFKTGFVPTMGALHQGHLSLIKMCKNNGEVCFSSIFVNPTQFNDPEDFQKYPRTLDEDIQILADSGCDYVYIPEIHELYPDGQDKIIKIELGHLAQVLEAKSRPGHFDGVITIVKKLFDIFVPDSAYFGQKDYQQYLVIKKMTELFNLSIKLNLCPVIREKDGLAMSSRNRLLTPEERQIAPVIYRTLYEASKSLKIKSLIEIKNKAEKRLRAYNLVNVEYFEILDAETLLNINFLEDANKILICTALKIGKIRLIDNILVVL
jgi:pantoate--beta-alanine ligase